MFSFINILNCLPRLLALSLVQCVFKHVCTRLTILTSSFFIITELQDRNNWSVGSGNSRLGLQIYFFIISEKAERIDYMDGRRVCGATRIKWAVYIYIHKYIYI